MPLQKLISRGIQSHSQAGMTTIEVLVATIVFAIASTGLAGALSVGLFAAEKNHDATLAQDLAQSQLENIVAAEYREAGDYPTFVELPLDYETVTTTEPIKPGLLQKVVTRVTFRGNPEAEITAFKTNRLLDTGLSPPSGGIEALRAVSIPSPLLRKTGFFLVLEVLDTVTPSNIWAKWLRVSDDDHGDDDDHSISLTIYRGTPFGISSSGISTLRPTLVPGETVVTFVDKNFSLGLYAEGVQPGIYTIYFFNEDGNKKAYTSSANIAFAGP